MRGRTDRPGRECFARVPVRECASADILLNTSIDSMENSGMPIPTILAPGVGVVQLHKAPTVIVRLVQLSSWGRRTRCGRWSDGGRGRCCCRVGRLASWLRARLPCDFPQFPLLQVQRKFLTNIQENVSNGLVSMTICPWLVDRSWRSTRPRLICRQQSLRLDPPVDAARQSLPWYVG